VPSELHRFCTSGASAFALSLAALLLPLNAPAVPASAYDAAAAATRTEYSRKVARCKTLQGPARLNCTRAAKAQAHAALGHTYEGAVAAAKSAYTSAAAKCRPLNRAEHRRCLRAAKSERTMALGRAEEIRSAPLAMGMN